MKVSIQIPTYNQEHYIERAVQSALMQDYEDVEVVVLDDCSTDNTLQIAQRIDAVAVGQLIDIGVIWIVRGAQRIDVELLHDPHVLLHPFAADGVTGIRIMFVAVYAADGDRPAVDRDEPVAHRDGTKSDLFPDSLKRPPRRIGKDDVEGVQIGRFGSPRSHTSDGLVENYARLIPGTR